MAQRGVPQPESPPKVERRISFHKTQLIGVPILLILPVLALLGLFGTTAGVSQSEANGLEVRYPERIRYRLPDTLTIKLTNRGEAGDIQIALSSEYLDAFAEAQPSTEPVDVTQEEHVFDLGTVQPRETKLFSIDFRAEKAGRHKGWIEVRQGGQATERVEFQTLIYP